MSDSKRVTEIISGLRLAKAQEEERLERNSRIQRLEGDFRRQWDHAFLPLEEFFDQTIQRMLALGEALLDRHWDYLIAESLSDPDIQWDHELALITLRYSCQQNEPELRKSLIAVGEYSIRVKDALEEVYRVCQMKRGLPMTPPLNQPQMADALGISRDQFRSQFRSEQWKADDSKGHARKWLSTDPVTQERLLVAIRKLFPEKIWVGNRPPKRESDARKT